MSLRASFTVQRGELCVQLDLEVARGETLALVGPNGAGKSTALAAIAGLLPIDSGSITLGERILEAPAKHIFLEPEERQVGFVFQEALLFPHLDVRRNLAYGLRAHGQSRDQAAELLSPWVEQLGLGGLLHRRPHSLSGGQVQRVALARALVAQPEILLLDEPLSAVDASGRLELRRTLREHMDAFEGVRIVVAHDARDAMALADRMAVIEAGRLTQCGTVEEICVHPRSVYVADLVGLNAVAGELRAGCLSTPSGGELRVASDLSGSALATIHPRAVALYGSRPEGSPRNVWRASVGSIEPAVDRWRVQLAGPIPLVAEVTRAATDELGLRPGSEVWIAVKATEIRVERV